LLKRLYGSLKRRQALCTGTTRKTLEDISGIDQTPPITGSRCKIVNSFERLSFDRKDH
jgi:hypothetical protein